MIDESQNLDCGGVEGMRQRSHQWHHPDGQTAPLGPSSGDPRAFHLQWGSQGAVAGHTHGGEEVDAGVHVHGRDRADDLAHDAAERPAEVQHRVYGPERQGQDELEVGQRQAHHEAVNGGVVVAPAAGVEQEQCQEVTHKPQHTHH